MVGDLAYVTGMVRKDVLRTDRHHKFYAGNDDNQNIASLFNILTTLVFVNSLRINTTRIIPKFILCIKFNIQVCFKSSRCQLLPRNE